MRRTIRFITALTLALAFQACKKDSIARNALIHDLPVGYDDLEEPPQKPFRTHLEDVTASGETIYSDDSVFSVSERAKTELEKAGLKRNDEEVTTVEGDVNLRLWKAQPRVFVHLEDEDETKSSKKKSK